MARKILGVEIGAGVVRISLLVQTAQSYRIKFKDEQDFDPATFEEGAQKALSFLVKKYKLKYYEAVLVLSEVEPVYKSIILPLMPASEVSAALRFQLTEVFPLPIGDMVYNFKKVDGYQDETRQFFFVAALSKKQIETGISILEKSGLRVKNAVSPAEAFLSYAKEPSESLTAQVLLNGGETLILLVKGRQILFAREVGEGLNSIARNLVGTVSTGTGQIAITDEMAKKIFQDYGIPLDPDAYASKSNLPASSMFGMMRPALERIGAEILRTFEYYQLATGDSQGVKEIGLSGNGLTIANMIEYFVRSLNLPVKPIEPRLSIDPQYILSYGAALNQNQEAGLLPHDFRFPIIRLMRSYLRWWNVALVYLLILFAVNSFYTNLESSTRETAKKLDLQVTNYVGPNNAALDEKIVVGILQDYGGSERTSVFSRFMRALSTIAPDNVYFKTIQFDNRSANLDLSGVMVKGSSENAIAGFISAMKKSGYFETLDLTNLTDNNKYSVTAYDFGIKGKLVMPQALPAGGVK